MRSASLRASGLPGLANGLALIGVVGFFLAGCGSPDRVAGGTTDTGNSLDVLAGLALGADSLPAKQTPVRLRRADYLTPLPVGSKRSAGSPGWWSSGAAGIERIDTVTGSDGRFRIADIAAGAYRLELGDDSLVTALVELDLRDLSRHPEDRLDLPATRLARPTVVTGSLRFRPTAVMAYIQVHGLERLGTASAAAGRFHLSLPPGAFRLRFTDPDCGSGCNRTANVTVAGEDTLDIGAVDLRGQAEPYLAWRHGARLAVDTKAGGAGIGGQVTGFPMLVRLDSAIFDFGEAAPDGADIRFSKAGAKVPLPYEIERWDAAARKAEIWVRLDTVRGDDDAQFFHMHWGNDTAKSLSDGKAVFDAAGGHRGVWHLAEKAGGAAEGFKDATANGNHGTGGGLTDSSWMDGAVGGAQRFAAADAEIKVPDQDALDVGTGDFTLSVWARADSLLGKHQLVCKRSSPGADYEIQLLADANVESHVGKDPDIKVVTGRNTVRLGEWHHLALQRSGDRLVFFLDGVENMAETDTPRDLDNDGDFYIGRDFADNLQERWKGGIDEVRLAASAASADWIRLCYQSQRSGSTVMRFSRTQ